MNHGQYTGLHDFLFFGWDIQKNGNESKAFYHNLFDLPGHEIKFEGPNFRASFPLKQVELQYIQKWNPRLVQSGMKVRNLVGIDEL
jgi:hypothetical protein